jgi:hypothetical protein
MKSGFNYQRPKDPRLKALPDPKDTRDFIYRKITAPVTLPPVFDLEKLCTKVKDQGQRGSCVGFASVATKEQHFKARAKMAINLSEEWTYDQIMQPGGGANPRDAYKLFVEKGVCVERYLRYRKNEQDETPVTFVMTKVRVSDAAQHKSSGYARLQTLQDMKLSLYQNGAFMIGVDWLDGWFEPKTIAKGYPLVQKFEGEIAGGHALCVVGYDDHIKAFKVKNSWSRNWGRNGYFYMSYDAVDQNLNDAWTTFDINAVHIKSEALPKAS